MNKTFVGFIFLLFLVGGVVSCQRSSSPYPYSLRYADSLMEISPERTLAIFVNLMFLLIQRVTGHTLAYCSRRLLIKICFLFFHVTL